MDNPSPITFSILEASNYKSNKSTDDGDCCFVRAMKVLGTFIYAMFRTYTVSKVEDINEILVLARAHPDERFAKAQDVAARLITRVPPEQVQPQIIAPVNGHISQQVDSQQTRETGHATSQPNHATPQPNNAARANEESRVNDAGEINTEAEPRRPSLGSPVVLPVSNDANNGTTEQIPALNHPASPQPDVDNREPVDQDGEGQVPQVLLNTQSSSTSTSSAEGSPVSHAPAPLISDGAEINGTRPQPVQNSTSGNSVPVENASTVLTSAAATATASNTRAANARGQNASANPLSPPATQQNNGVGQWFSAISGRISNFFSRRAASSRLQGRNPITPVAQPVTTSAPTRGETPGSQPHSQTMRIPVITITVPDDEEALNLAWDPTALNGGSPSADWEQVPEPQEPANDDDAVSTITVGSSQGGDDEEIADILSGSSGNRRASLSSPVTPGAETGVNRPESAPPSIDTAVRESRVSDDENQNVSGNIPIGLTH